MVVHAEELDVELDAPIKPAHTYERYRVRVDEYVAFREQAIW
jgi:hypothetical protein